VTDTATHGTQELQFKYPLAGIREILVGEGACSWGKTAENIHNLQREGIHAIILHTVSRTQRARLGHHTEAIPPKRLTSD